MKFVQKLKKPNYINIQRLFISVVFLFNTEIYAGELSCHKSWKEAGKVTDSNGKKLPEQTREGNYTDRV